MRVLDRSALEVFEEEFGVFFFIVACFLEDACDLFVAFFSGLAGEECVTCAGLGFARECC